MKRIHLKMASSGSTVVEQLSHHLKVGCLSLARATNTVSERMGKITLKKIMKCQLIVNPLHCL